MSSSMNRHICVRFFVLPIFFCTFINPLFAGFPGAMRVVVPGVGDRTDLKRIDNLKVGDKIVSCHADGDYVETTIQCIEKIDSPAFFKISMQGSSRFPIDKTRGEDRFFYASPQQKFYDHKKRQWIEAQYLSRQDSLTRLSSTKYNRIKSIGIRSRRHCSQEDFRQSKSLYDGSISYNIILDFPHTYFVVDHCYPANIPPYQEILTHNGDVITVLLSGIAPVAAVAGTAGYVVTAGAIVFGALGLAYLGHRYLENQKLLDNAYLNPVLFQTRSMYESSLFKLGNDEVEGIINFQSKRLDDVPYKEEVKKAEFIIDATHSKTFTEKVLAAFDSSDMDIDFFQRRFSFNLDLNNLNIPGLLNSFVQSLFVSGLRQVIREGLHWVKSLKSHVFGSNPIPIPRLIEKMDPRCLNGFDDGSVKPATKNALSWQFFGDVCKIVDLRTIPIPLPEPESPPLPCRARPELQLLKPCVQCNAMADLCGSNPPQMCKKCHHSMIARHFAVREALKRYHYSLFRQSSVFKIPRPPKKHAEKQNVRHINLHKNSRSPEPENRNNEIKDDKTKGRPPGGGGPGLNSNLIVAATKKITNVISKTYQTIKYGLGTVGRIAANTLTAGYDWCRNVLNAVLAPSALPVPGNFQRIMRVADGARKIGNTNDNIKNYVLEIVDSNIQNTKHSDWTHIICAPKHMFYKLCNRSVYIQDLITEFAKRRGFVNKNIDLIANNLGKSFPKEIQSQLIEETPKIVEKITEAILDAWNKGVIKSDGLTIFQSIIDGIVVEFKVHVQRNGYEIVKKTNGILNKTLEILCKIKLNISTVYVHRDTLFK